MDKNKKLNLLTEKAELLKVLAHPVRLCILNCLLTETCNVTGLVTQMEIPQSTVSQHLSKLRSAGIIKGHRNGLEVKYQVIDKEIIEVLDILLPKNFETIHYHENIN